MGNSYGYVDGILSGSRLSGEWFIADILTGVKIRCILSAEQGWWAIERIGRRVATMGPAEYDQQGNLIEIKAEQVAVFPEDSTLPMFREGEQIDLTGGVDSVEFTRRLRDAD